jgi:hypothetical protein
MRRKFSAQEDKLLCRLVEKSPNNWDAIAAEFTPSRSKRQLRERWQNYLDPHLELGYTKAEDDLLCGLFSELGPQWAKIAATMGKKSSTSTRNRHRLLQTLEAKGQRPSYGQQTPVVIEQERLGCDDVELPNLDPEFSYDVDEFFFA